MFWVLGIPSAALWGMVTVLTSVLPLIGAAAVWIPGTPYLLVIGHWAQAIVLAVWGTAVISGVDNFLRPKLVGDRVGLSELVNLCRPGGLTGVRPPWDRDGAGCLCDRDLRRLERRKHDLCPGR